MTLLQRFLRWWKEYGASILTLAGLGATALIWFTGKTGFVLLGPSDAVGQVKVVVNQRLDSVAVALDSGRTDRARLRRDIDSTQREVAYTLRAVEAGNRVTCFRDRPAAEVAGILCPSGKVPR